MEITGGNIHDKKTTSIRFDFTRNSRFQSDVIVSDQ